MVELIEHLHANQLEQIEQNVFGFLNPKVVIVSTPNSDFNSLFLKTQNLLQPNGFRHPDHKFEFSRN
jgi:predicted SAM-dependent methyltransferase